MLMEKNAWKWRYLGLMLFFLVSVNLVYLGMALRTPADHHYTGIGGEAVGDKLVYYSMIEQGMQGVLFMINPQTSEQQQTGLFSPHWYLIGMTARILHMSIPLSYHMYRLLLIVIFFGLMYAFVRKLFSDERNRFGALIAALFASGLGWFYFLTHADLASQTTFGLQTLNRIPVDLYVTEMSAFSNAIQSPLFILSYILIIGIFFLFIRQYRGCLPNLLLGFCALLLVLIHPYDAVLISGVAISFFVWQLMRNRKWDGMISLVVLGASVALGLAYHLIAFLREPVLASWLSQNITISPGIGSYLWGLGLLAPLSLVGIYFLWKNRETNPWWSFVIIWSLWIAVSIYLPVQFNRRLSSTWFIPLGLLSYYAFIQILSRIRQGSAKIIVVVLLSILVFSGRLVEMTEDALYTPAPEARYAYYLDPLIWDALQYGRSHMSYRDVLLANEPFISLLAGAYAPVRLYSSHSDQTVRYPLKQESATWFFGASPTAGAVQNKKEFLQRNGISYIMLYKPSLRSDIGWIRNAPFLSSVYDSPIVTIFQVI